MAFIVYFLSILILVSSHWQAAAFEDCALAGKPNNQDSTVQRNARRQDLPDTRKFVPFSGAEPNGKKVMRQGGVYTRADMTLGLHDWKVLTTPKTPPTDFFPRGSSAVTVTVKPLTFLYVHPQSQATSCDLWIRNCMKVYDTGYVCAHALHGTSYTFLNYCSMEYANCTLKLNLWQLAYFGSCNVERMPDVGEDFDIEGDNFLEAALINSPPFNPLTGKAETYM